MTQEEKELIIHQLSAPKLAEALIKYKAYQGPMTATALSKYSRDLLEDIFWDAEDDSFTWADSVFSELKYSSQRRYDKANTTTISIKLNKKTDKDILNWLNKYPNKQGIIKQLIRDKINS